MAKAYKPEIMEIAPAQTLPYMNSPISFLRIKKITGADFVEVQIGQNGGFFAEMQVGRKIEMQTPVEFLNFRNPNTGEGENITIEFYALDGFKDTDDLLSIDPDTPVTINDLTPVKVDVQNFPAAQPVEIQRPDEACQVNKSVSATSTVHTVAAGKKLYLNGVYVYAAAPGSSVFVTDDADTVLYYLIDAAIGYSFPLMSFSRPIVLSTGSKIKTVLPAGGAVSIFGEEL